MNEYALILAGGKGSRLWPISTRKKPKQFLKLYGNDNMINQTIYRISSMIDYNNIFIIINKSQDGLVYENIDSRIPRENIIVEPLSKSTAMCIFYATLKIKKMKGDGVISVFSADHYINDIDKLNENIKYALNRADKNKNIITIGIIPTYPATEFGYIKYGKHIENNLYLIKEFREKPNLQKAVEYLKSNQYFWNSGIFIWSIACILKNFQKYLPDIYMLRDELYNTILTENEINKVKKIYTRVQSISIDKGILEKTEGIEVIKGDFEWLDIGNINDYFKIYPKNNLDNVFLGNIISNETKQCNILNKTNELIVTVGIQDLNIIKCNGVCLICDKNNLKNVSEILKQIESNKKYKKYI